MLSSLKFQRLWGGTSVSVHSLEAPTDECQRDSVSTESSTDTPGNSGSRSFYSKRDLKPHGGCFEELLTQTRLYAATATLFKHPAHIVGADFSVQQHRYAQTVLLSSVHPCPPPSL